MRKIRRRKGEKLPETTRSETLNINVPSRCSDPRRLQIVGFKNSGKTTLTENLLRAALDRGCRTSTIKHHGHGGAPELPPSGTDASRFFESGADSSIVVGGGVMLLQGRQPQTTKPSDELEALIRYTDQYAQPDLILIEGFKNEPYPKIVLIRSFQDWEELRLLTNIQLVVTADDDLAAQLSAAILLQPCRTDRLKNMVISRQRLDDITAWFIGWLKGERHESL